METPILIVGAGPAGLCSSISLSRLGVRSVLIERHPSTSIHPKATGVSTRTMELFRSWGLEPRIRELALNVDFVSSVRANLAAPESERRSLGYPTRDEARAFSPTAPAVLAQDILEPILAAHARSYRGAELHFNAELCFFEPTDDGVRAIVLDRTTGDRTTIDARYMIAADGANSPVRRHLGISMHGVERIGEYLSILFRADIQRLVGPRQCGLYMLQGLGGPAPTVAVPTANDGRWVLATPWRGDVRPLSSMSDKDLIALVRQAAGAPDLVVDLLDVQLIGIGAQVAERFRDGNVFLVGDAAHRTAPTGGTGMNTAIHSAYNLAWKLAAVMSGDAGDALLDSYEPERRPPGERNLLRSRGQLQGVSGVAADMGAVYSSGAVMAEDGAARPVVIEPTDVAGVGARAPHVWLGSHGERLSILDLFGYGFVLLTGPMGSAWRSAARHVSDALGVPLGTITVGGAWLAVESIDWMRMYGIEGDGAVLVRPDGHIAWRSAAAAADATATLTTAVARVLGRSHEEVANLVDSVAGADRRCA
jgi:2-polyprenyl-6-methoxyphenol hydroxylase-like FAD-dependent oxidoreductase